MYAPEKRFYKANTLDGCKYQCTIKEFECTFVVW